MKMLIFVHSNGFLYKPHGWISHTYHEFHMLLSVFFLLTFFGFSSSTAITNNINWNFIYFFRS